MDIKKILVISLASLALGVYLGKKFTPPVVETKEVTKDVIQHDVVTVTKEVIRPDGTKEVLTTSTDKSQEKKEKVEVKTVAQLPPNWHISASLERASLTSTNIYALQVERRILGPAFLSLRVNTDKVIGIGVGYEF